MNGYENMSADIAIDRILHLPTRSLIKDDRFKSFFDIINKDNFVLLEFVEDDTTVKKMIDCYESDYVIKNIQEKYLTRLLKRTIRVSEPYATTYKHMVTLIDSLAYSLEDTSRKEILTSFSAMLRLKHGGIIV